MSNFTKRCSSACFVTMGPIEPAGFVVLAVGVVVAVLAVPRFVAHENYWDAE